MGYSKEVYTLAEQLLSERRAMANRVARVHREEIKNRCPRAVELEQEIAMSGIKTARIILSGGADLKQQIDRLAKENLAQQAEFKAIMEQNGYPIDYMDPQFECKDCKDEGYIDGRQCSCLRKLLREVSYRKLNVKVSLQDSSFEKFDLSFYSNASETNAVSPRQQMERNFAYCLQYAKNFSVSTAESILMTGATGLGKTHLSFAIAKEVIDRGYGVVYGSAQNLIQKVEKQHFGRSDSDEDVEKSLLECDLLILDDLGAEFTTQFSISVIYNIVNSRLLANLPTIINTNLTISELEKQYGGRVVSRMIGNYHVLPFVGKDIRQQKRMRELGK